MEKKKDYTITKINTERSFAEEVFKKYRKARYGIGTCCGTNLPSYIKDKYLCDYQDSKVTQYDSVAVTKTAYTPSIETCKKDEDMPAWVDKLCGIKNSDVEIYFYYDATSLGVAQVQAAHTAATAWVAYARAQEDNTITQKDIDESCRDPQKPVITEYHTTVWGERWLDWGISALTGTFNNAGSCGGNGTGCVAGAAVDFGLCETAGAVDSAFPKSVAPNSKFWSILKWAQANNHVMYNGSWYNGSAAGQTVLSTFSDTNTSGGTFSSVVTIGEAPAATKKNVLIVTFIDESSSPTYVQPYYIRPSSNPSPMTWAFATSGAGSAASGSDAVLTPCWKADYDEFIARRAEYLDQGNDYCLNAYCYPSKPANVGAPHWPFALHSVGAISSGDKTLVGATGTITIVDNPVNGNTITLTSTDLIVKTYTAAAATDIITRQFISTGSVTEVATALKLCIEAANGHNGKITVTQSSGVLTVTQSIGGEYGDNTITSTALTSDITVAGFTGGVGDGTWTTPPFNSISNLGNLTLGNPYYDQRYGALDVFGWGINPAELPFSPEGFNSDLNTFVDFTECNDSECFLFIVKDQNGLPICDHPIVFDGGIVTYTDEDGLARWCVENASIYQTHTLDLCYCITTTGNCASQKINITVTDDCFTACETTPFIACEAKDEVISSGNIAEGCTDPLADNYDPNAITDDGSCLYCSSLTVSYEYEDDSTDCSPGDGWITVTISGGTGPYTFNWLKDGSQFATTQNLTALCGGQYLLTVVDSSTPNPCTETLVVYIDQPATIVYGCMDVCACNYGGVSVTNDDGSCLYKGCTKESDSTNFGQRICADTGLVIAGVPTADCNCEEVGTANYQNLVNWDSCCEGCVYGCMDPSSNNYDAAATCDDGSCTYNYNCVQVTTGTSTTNSCDGMTNIGQFTSLSSFNNHISDIANNLQSTPFDTMTYQNITLAATTDQCILDNFPLAYSTGFNFNFADETPGVFTGCTFSGTTYYWPSTWVTAIPNPGVNIYYRVFTSSQNWNDIIDFLNATIADGQTWINSSGTTITTFTGVSKSGIENICNASQGSAHSGNPNPHSNLIWPECPGVMFQFQPQGGNCICTDQPTTECDCIEMTDGTGIYPDDTCTPNSGTNCCQEPVTMYICDPGTSSNDCSNKTLINSTVVWSFGINLGAALAEAWISSFSSIATGIDQIIYQVDGGYTSTSCVTVPATTPPSITMYIQKIQFYHNGTVETNMCLGCTTSISWNQLINYLKSTYGYDGTTYPDVTGHTYNQLRNVLALAEPGVWDSQVELRSCNCSDQVGCECREDPSGTLTLSECEDNCCDDPILGCTDPSAVNYNNNATWDNNSCYYCDDFGQNNSPSILTNISITNPTSSTNCDGELYAELSVAIPGNSGTTQILWQIYDNNLLLITSGTIPEGGPYNFTATGLCNDTYHIFTYWQNIFSSNINQILGVICQDEITRTVGTIQSMILWDCVPGTITDSSENRIYLPNYDASIPLTNALPSAALLDYSKYGLYLSFDGIWFYLNTTSTYFVLPYVAGATDCTNNGPAVKMTIESLKIKVVIGGAIYYDLPAGGTWSDLTAQVSTLTGTSSTDMNYTEIVAALAAYSGGSHILEETYVKEVCDFTNCDCQESPTGEYLSESSCNDDCCNIGCTDSTADNYDANATIDDGSCMHCDGFQALISLQQDSVAPAGSTYWTGSNINVNNAKIVCSVSGGSNSYSTSVYYQGYNNNMPTNGLALFPGTYKVVVHDKISMCQLVFSDVTVGKLKTACHDDVTNFIPSQTWNTSTGPLSVPINNITYAELGGPNTSYNIYNNPAANSGFTVDNLPLHASNYDIQIFKWNGSTYVTQTSGSIVTSLSSGAQVAGEYYVEIRKRAEACDDIGFLFEYTGAANP